MDTQTPVPSEILGISQGIGEVEEERRRKKRGGEKKGGDGIDDDDDDDDGILLNFYCLITGANR